MEQYISLKLILAAQRLSYFESAIRAMLCVEYRISEQRVSELCQELN